MTNITNSKVPLKAGYISVSNDTSNLALSQSHLVSDYAQTTPKLGPTEQSGRRMFGKIALEEHFLLPGFHGFLPPGFSQVEIDEVHGRLLDVRDKRLTEMDQYGIKIQILSLTADGIQGEVDPKKAIRLAIEANDGLLKNFISPYPSRFAGFASIALQDHKAAADELERTVKNFGFKGALVNGYTNIGNADTGEYYDHPKFIPFWERVAELDVPVYLHPRLPLPSQRIIYQGHDEMLGPVWAFNTETAAHALRLITSGLFDRFEKLNIILGHMGEGLISMIWRCENRFNKATNGKKLRKPLSQYLTDNFYITTSGHFQTQALVNAIMTVGADRIMFSLDYPYEDTSQGANWFDNCAISEIDRLKIGRLNAEKLFRV